MTMNYCRIGGFRVLEILYIYSYRNFLGSRHTVKIFEQQKSEFETKSVNTANHQTLTGNITNNIKLELKITLSTSLFSNLLFNIQDFTSSEQN